MTNILALLIPCQLLRLPTVPFSSAVYHIHSPERFLEAHGLAPAGVRVTETFKPVASRGSNLIAFNLRTPEGVMFGRMYSEGPYTSDIVLLDSDERVCLMGRLSVKPDGLTGASILVSSSAPTRGAMGSASVCSAILAADVLGNSEDANLLLYRRRVLYPRTRFPGTATI
jgi:hypothetical protein